MYVRSDDDSDKRTHNPRTGKGEAAQQSLALTVDVAPPVMSEIIRAVTVNMKSRRGAPCSARRDETPEKVDHGGISGKSFIDPEVLRRQRAEETRVYGENACRAIPEPS